MRAHLLVALAGLALAQAPQPQKVVFSRVFPQPGQIGLFLANVDGTNERRLVTPADIDYDAAWAPDGASIVFTSERNGSADLYRVKPDGTGFICCLIWSARPRYPMEDGWKKVTGSDDEATRLDRYEVLPCMGFELMVPVLVSARGRSVWLSR